MIAPSSQGEDDPIESYRSGTNFIIGVTSQLIGVVYAVFDVFMTRRIYTYESRHVVLIEKANLEHAKK